MVLVISSRRRTSDDGNVPAERLKFNSDNGKMYPIDVLQRMSHSSLSGHFKLICTRVLMAMH